IVSNVPITHPRGARLWGEFAQALRDLGYVEGRNLTIENLSSNGRYDRLPTLAAELIRHKVDVIVAPAAQNVIAAKAASATIPIVMAGGGGPNRHGPLPRPPPPRGDTPRTALLAFTPGGKPARHRSHVAP